MGQFNIENCRLNFIQSKIPADKVVPVLRAHPVVATLAQLFSKLFVAANYQPGVTSRPQIFGWIKTETTDIANRSSSSRSIGRRVFRANRLRGVFDQHQVMLARDSEHFGHVATHSEKMRRNERNDSLSVVACQFALNDVAL